MTTPQRDYFPPIEAALEDPNGLLAVGGDLSVARLLAAYEHGIFPWSDESQPLLWWSPDPRAVIAPGDVKISRSLRRSMRRENFGLSVNRAFEQVTKACAELRVDGAGTWITSEMLDAYLQLHRMGFAHSLEVWAGDELVGGLYGVAVGQLFCGESMFHRRSNASKMAFVALCASLKQHHWPLIDCQILNPHLESLGVTTIGRNAFKQYLPAHSARESQVLPIAEKDQDGANSVGGSPDWHTLPWTDTGALERAVQ